MGLTIKSTEGQTPIEPGNWPAACCGYIQLGTHTSTFGDQTKRGPRLMLMWWMEEQRREIARRYSLTLHSKGTLRATIEAMMGKLTPEMEAELDLDHLIGKPCLLDVRLKTKTDGKTFAEVHAISSLPRGMSRPGLKGFNSEAGGAAKIYVMHDSEGRFQTPPAWVPDWVKKIISESEESIAAAKAAAVNEAPF